VHPSRALRDTSASAAGEAAAAAAGGGDASRRAIAGVVVLHEGDDVAGVLCATGVLGEVEERDGVAGLGGSRLWW
jgi:hypothetical protein